MYYVLFTWIKGTKERDFQGFRTKPELIEFLGKNFEKIMVWNIHKAATEYRFGLVEKESKPEEGGAFMQDLTPESDEEHPKDYLGSFKIPEEAILEPEEKKHPLLKDRKEEPSAIEKIADDIEVEIKDNNLTEGKHIKLKEDLTDAEIIAQNKKTLEKMVKAPTIEETLSRGKKALEAAEKEQSDTKKTWRICSKCNSNRISPVNKTGICTPCQHKRKTDRPYTRRAKF